MWFLRRMQRISYTEHVTNVEVLRRANTKRKRISEMVNRQMKFFGHVMRKQEMENLVTTGYVEGNRARSRQRETYQAYLQKNERKDTNRTDPPDKREEFGLNCQIAAYVNTIWHPGKVR